MNALHDGGDTLDPHAGINGRLRQRLHHAIGLTVELHEHHVPDLDETITIFFRRARWATPDIGTMVVKNFGARATRPGVAHLPEVVRRIGCALIVTNAHNPIRRNTNLLGPDIIGFVIGGIDGNQQLLLWKFQYRGQKTPGKGNSVTLEIITKTEVTQHLEEGVMTSRVTDVIQIVVLTTGPNTTL